MSIKAPLLATILCLLTASVTQAAVTVTNSTEVVSDRTNGTADVATFSTTIDDWSLNGGNVVAVICLVCVKEILPGQTRLRSMSFGVVLRPALQKEQGRRLAYQHTFKPKIE